MVSPQSQISGYYILIYKPKHPRAVAEGYVAEQVLVAEKVLGRYLSPDEDVRHINGNPQDNRPENLEIITMNADFKVISLTNNFQAPRKSAARTFMPCKFQKPCWKEVRAPKARKHKIFLPYICSYQSEGDVPKCGIFWDYIDKTLKEEEETKRSYD
jgi:hypothetical protein